MSVESLEKLVALVRGILSLRDVQFTIQNHPGVTTALGAELWRTHLSSGISLGHLLYFCFANP